MSIPHISDEQSRSDFHHGLLAGLFVARSAVNLAREAANQQTTAARDQALISGKQQAALDRSIGELEKLQGTLDKSRQAVESQLQLFQAQRAEELARLRQKPDVEISIGALTWRKIQAHETGLVSDLDAGGNQKISIHAKNVGDAPLTDPIFEFASADAPSVDFNPRQIANPVFRAMPPYSMVPQEYNLDVAIRVPPDIQRFTLTVLVLGSTYRRQISIPLRVVRPAVVRHEAPGV